MFRHATNSFKTTPKALTPRPFTSTPFLRTSRMSSTINQSPLSPEQAQKDAQNSTDLSSANLGIENTNISTASGITLSDQQRILVGSVLDLFAGRPSLEKLGLWTDNAKFQDPLTIAEGRKQYAAQWYGLKAAFSEIERIQHSVTSAGNPIKMDLKTRYKMKVIGKEQVIESKVEIFTNGQGKIMEVQDRWNGYIPDGPIAKAFRNLNSVVVPAFVSVPKNEEQDRKQGN